MKSFYDYNLGFTLSMLFVRFRVLYVLVLNFLGKFIQSGAYGPCIVGALKKQLI